MDFLILLNKKELNKKTKLIKRKYFYSVKRLKWGRYYKNYTKTVYYVNTGKWEMYTIIKHI